MNVKFQNLLVNRNDFTEYILLYQIKTEAELCFL